ncbi:DUF4232 domain-containing protein [Streptomyces triculaminicus]|uniref:DUF4232 domain-containing protein n=2 Tax=Streptomyces TaxID=1883 RepID=A0A939FQX1_9ACTN|nr:MULTISPECIES: DUF4232 domain-containing protein [Streptomyces]MBO0654397.1 DUF4232 domain-containing protein [Streptomyces triculaminicus]QSY49026.1 DUF4232 domain-containing protein [Streptomyces griseocarneus]
MRVHKLTFATLAVAAGLLLTACQGDDDGTGKSAPSSASSASSASSTGGGSGSGGSGSGGSDQGGGKDSAGKSPAGKSSGGQGTAAGTGSKESGKAGKCRTDELEITAKDRTIDGDSDATVVVELKNRGGHSCAISGYAGVDLKTNAGSLSAKRTGEQAPSTILKDGQSTFFGISYPFNTSGGSGVRITGLLVTPPSETKSVSLPWPGAATLPVTDGSGSPVKVGPIGSAGQGG